MKYSTAKQGRTFIIRLEHGEIVHEELEKIAYNEGVKAAYIIGVGGIDEGSNIIVGPENGKELPATPINKIIENDAHEIVATGTIFPDIDTAKPVLHMHMACGREDETITGCIRNGMKTWHVLEFIMVELLHSNAARVLDEKTGFKLLDPKGLITTT